MHLLVFLGDGILVDLLELFQQHVRELSVALVKQGTKVNGTPHVSELSFYTIVIKVKGQR